MKKRGLILLLVLFLAVLSIANLVVSVRNASLFNVAIDYLRGEGSIAAQINDRDIFLVDFADGVVWDEKWQEFARVAFAVIPSDINRLISKEKPLKISLKKEISGDVLAYYVSINNSIVIDWGDFEESKQKEYILATIFHEIGHAVDFNLENNWKEFVRQNPKMEAYFREIYEPNKGDFMRESFAYSFQDYIFGRWHQ